MISSPVHVLMVDDDKEYYILVRELLVHARGSFEVTWADSCAAARGMIDRGGFDIILVDYRLDDGTGVDLLQYAGRVGSTVPMIMLTGMDDEETELEAMHAGATDYIYKGRLDIRILERTLMYALERKRMTDALRTSEERLRTVVSNAPVILFATDLNGVITLAEGLGLAALGVSSGELVGRHIGDIYVHMPAIERNVLRALAGETFSEVIRFGTVTLDTRYSPAHDPHGRISGMVGVGTDITARVRSERALRESEEHFRRLIENAEDIIAVLEEDGTIRYDSPAVGHVLGYGPAELVGRSAFELVHPDELDQALEMFGDLLADPGSTRTSTLRYLHRDGFWIWMETTGTNLLHDPTLRGVVVNARDVSERRRMEEERAAAVKALSESEENYRIVAETASDAIVTIDEEGTILFVNNASERIFGYPVGELLGQNISMLMPERMRDLHGLGVHGYLRTGQRTLAWDATVQVARHASGREFPIEISIADYRRDGRHMFTGIARDITERVQAHRRLEESQQLNDAILQSLSAHIAVLDREGHIVAVNQAWERFGLDNGAFSPLAATLGANYLEICGNGAIAGAEGAAEAREGIEEVLAGRTTEFTIEYPCHSPSERRWFLLSVTALKAHGGAVVSHLDITEQKSADMARQQSQARFLSFVNNSPAVFYLKDESGRYVLANEHFAELVGKDVDEIIGTTDADHWPAEVADRFVEADRRVRESGRPVQTQDTISGEHGDRHWFTIRFPAPGEAGEMLVGGASIEITERIQAEASLRKSEERFQLVTRATNDAIWDWDLVDDNVWWNDNVRTLFGYNPEEMTSMIDFWYQRIHPSDQSRVVTRLHAAIDSGSRFWTDDYRFLRGDGSYAYVFDRGYVLHDQGRPVRMIGAMVDITERKNVEEALRDSETKYRRIVETSQEGIVVTDAAGMITFANARLAELLGYSVEEMLHTAYADYMDDDGRSLARGKANRRREGIAEQYDFKFIRKDGSPVWTIVSANPVFAKDGSIVGSLGMIADITDRKRAEEALQEAHDKLEVRVAERTAEIVQVMARLEEAHKVQKRFVADASHDLRTPLTVVQAEVDLILQQKGLPAETRRSLLRVAAETKRLNSISNDLLLLATLDARSDESEVRTLERLDELLLEAVANLATLAQEKRLAWSIQIDEPIELLCDPSSLDRAITNVLDNAIKYSPDDSVVTVTLERRDGMALVTVADGGMGIPSEDLPKIFDRFYRSDLTRSTPGTGLGLAIVKAVVEAHGGTIVIESKTGVGTTVQLAFPCRP